MDNHWKLTAECIFYIAEFTAIAAFIINYLINKG